MTTSITATSTTGISDALFTKLDTKQKGYIDEADLKNAAEANGTDASKTAEVFKQLDTDSDGKVTKSELSAAVEKIGEQLNAQLDQSRMDKAGSGARPGGGGPGATTVDSDSADTNKYIAAADTNVDGTVSAEEAAAYEKLLANAAEAKAQAQAQEYAKTSELSAQTDSGSFAVSA